MHESPSVSPNFGIGPTEKLNLRVSVATLAKVMLDHPQDGRPMLVLERTTTLLQEDDRQKVVVKTKPFGGGVRLNQPKALSGLIGDFHFDSRRSQAEMDFRLFIRREDWARVKEFCLQHFKEQDSVLEIGPERELLEEFEDALNIKIRPDQYHLSPVGTVVEDLPGPTDNVRSSGSPTVRIYQVFEIMIVDPSLVTKILENSQGFSDEDLRQLARLDAERGGIGRANSVLALALEQLIAKYLSIQPEERGERMRFEGHQLEGNVPVLLEDVEINKYQRL